MVQNILGIDQAFKKKYEGNYVKYKQLTYIVSHIDSEEEMVTLKKANLISNWYARVEEFQSIRIPMEALRKESHIILKLELDKEDF